MRRPFYLVPGFSDEVRSLVFGTIEASVGKQKTESTERIDVILADRKEVIRILQEERTSLLSALLMQSFLKSTPDKPFAFLDLPE